MGVLSLAATGDSFITRRLPECDEHAREIAAIIGGADVRFTNLEVTIRRHDEGFPSAQSGGTWASAPPEVLKDLRAYRFNLIAWANNHTLDYSYGGMAATERYLDQYEWIHAGAGHNLAKASGIKYLDCAAGRVAFIAATSTFHESWVAGEQRPDMSGRPGVNPLRFQTIHRISKESLEHLKAIAENSGVNAKHNMSVKDGFAALEPSGVFRFGQHLFAEAVMGSKEGAVTSPHPKDQQRILRAIDEAKRQADLVLISIHAHEMKDNCKEHPADFLVEFSRACIDGGAHAVVGHGPHLVRGIEVYNNRPIFYSLGNFIFQNETVACLPADFYEKQGLDASHHTVDALEARSVGDTRGFGPMRKVWSSVIANWRMEDGELAGIELHPIDLGFGESRYRRGWPRLTQDETVLHELQQLSAPFGTKLRIEAGKAFWSKDS